MADQTPPAALPALSPAGTAVPQPQTQYQMPPQAFPPGYQTPQYPQGFPAVAPSTQQADQLAAFWQQQMVEVEQVGNDPAEFKNHQLPLARIKKIMKSDEDVRMISAEAPVLFAKACEMFILELTLRSWIHAEENKRRTLQRNDIAAAITKTDIFDFLVDIVPREEARPDNPEQRPPAPPHTMPAGAQGMYYPYPPMPGVPSDPSMMARPPPMPMDPTAMMYQQQFMSMQNAQWPQPPMPQAPMPQPAAPQPTTADASSQQ